MGKATNSIARRGQGGIPPCGVQRQRLWWGLGQRPNRFAGDQFKGNSQQRRRQRSVPASNFARPQTRPKLLYPQLAYCRARWARPTSMGEGFLSMLVFFVAGISPLRRRQGGFPIAPLTPSVPQLLGLSAAGFVRGKRFLYQRAFCLIIKPRQPLDNCPHMLPGLCYAIEKCTYACSNCELYSSA